MTAPLSVTSRDR